MPDVTVWLFQAFILHSALKMEPASSQRDTTSWIPKKRPFIHLPPQRTLSTWPAQSRRGKCIKTQVLATSLQSSGLTHCVVSSTIDQGQRGVCPPTRQGWGGTFHCERPLVHIRPKEAEWCPVSMGLWVIRPGLGSCLLTPGPGLFRTVLTEILCESLIFVLQIGGRLSPKSLGTRKCRFRDPCLWKVCARNGWEFNKRDTGDYLITLALEYVGESQGDGQGKLKAEAPFLYLNSPLTNLKGLKSFSKRAT